jgi:hypothetical protein
MLDLLPSVPMKVWGRDELGAGEMWNSNSVIAWLLVRCGLDIETIQPPAGGRGTRLERRRRRGPALVRWARVDPVTPAVVSTNHGQHRQRQHRDRDHPQGNAGREPTATAERVLAHQLAVAPQ